MRKQLEIVLVVLIVVALGAGVLASRGLVHAGAHEQRVLVERSATAARAGTPAEASAAASVVSTGAEMGISIAPSARRHGGEIDAGGAATAPRAALTVAYARALIASASAAGPNGITGAQAGGGDGYVTSNAATNPHGLAPSDTPSPIVSRIRVPVAGIDAEVDTGYVDRGTNAMLAPRGPWVVDWYPYSAVPGTGGNAVFAGHVDYINIGGAVFWHLRDLGPGDHIEITLADGSVLTYAVEYNRLYSAASGPWNELFNPGAGHDVLTIYTCDGNFVGGDYSSRRVVRGTRVR